MYREYFGFSDHPFCITADPGFLYLSKTHKAALANLRYGIEKRKGFIVVTGEVGCGKTLLCKKLLNELDPKIFETAYIYHPQANSAQLIRTILYELGCPADGLSEADLLIELNNRLIEKFKKGKEVVLILDEAQNLSCSILEHIRLLSNLETEKRKLIQIILLGQPELKIKLNRPELRQLKQRVLVYYDIVPLGKREIWHYINWRMGKVAKVPGFPSITYGAFRKICNYSKGIPRVINNLCEKAIMYAYSNKSEKITKCYVKSAIKEIEKLSI